MNSLVHSMNTPTGRHRLTIALCIYWGALFIGTHTPIQAGEDLSELDKLAHFGAYFGLGVLLTAWSMASGKSWKPIGVIVALAIYGALDEILQIPVGRNAEVLDWVADVCGATLGVTTTWYVVRSVLNKTETA